MLHSFPKRTLPPDEARRFQVLIDAVVDYANYMIDPDGIVATWNPGAERIKGYHADEILGRSFELFFTPEDRRAGKPRLALESARRFGRYESEGWRQRRDGSRFWALAVLDAIRDESGKLVGFAKVTRDMTERRAAEEALWESERRFRLLVNAVVDYGLFMLDRAGRISAWNAGAERIKGYAAREILGRHFSCFFAEEDRRAGIPEHALECAARDGSYTAEGWRVRKDGSRFWASVMIDAVRDESGQIIGFANVTRDSTERVEAERRLEEAREALHHAQKMESLGLLTGGIAHDFNNVLAAISNNLELVRQRAAGDSELVRHIEAALTAAQSGAGLVHQMLVFARKQPMRAQPIDVNATIEPLLSMLQRTTEAAIEIRADLDPGAAVIVADPNQVQSALLNLAVNARDAMPEGGTITIATARTRHPRAGDPDAPMGDFICISVADTGGGMPSEVLRRAFEPFFTTKEIGKGTGLGLSMVYGAIRQLGGEVTLESEVGRGTTARMFIPASVAAPAAAAVPEPDRRARDGDGVALLLVEDDPIVGMATVELLEGRGYRVRSASRGDEAVGILAAHPEIGILVTDVGLPGMDGHELVAEVRRLRPDFKVLFVTGYDRTGAMAAAPPGPNTAYLGKPYQPGELFEALQRLANASGSAHAA